MVSQVSSDEVGFSVHQTTNKFTDDYDGEGFNSGDKSPSGKSSLAILWLLLAFLV